MTLAEKDQLYNWHPYTQHQTSGIFPVVKKGQGALLWDYQEKEYIDAISSWWACPFGHCHPVLTEAIKKQLDQLDHVLFGGFSHVRAIELSEKLLSILPKNQKKVFFSDNGSTAVEVAIKASLQFFLNKILYKLLKN